MIGVRACFFDESDIPCKRRIARNKWELGDQKHPSDDSFCTRNDRRLFLLIKGLDFLNNKFIRYEKSFGESLLGMPDMHGIMYGHYGLLDG